MRKTTIIAALGLVLAVVVGGGAMAASTHSSTLSPNSNESVSSVWVELTNETETQIEVYTGGKYDERMQDTDTADELQTATYSGNWTVDGSGESAVATLLPKSGDLDDVEDGDISEWSGNTGKYSIKSGGPGESSHYIYYGSGASDGSWYNIHRPINTPTGQPTGMVSDIRVDTTMSSGYTSPHVMWQTSGGTTAIDVGISGSGEVQYYDGNGQTGTGITVSTDTWYTVKIEDVDYSSGTYTIRVLKQDGSVVGTAQATFGSDVDSISRINVLGGGNHFSIDNIGVGGQSAVYTAPAMAATNATEMTASIPSVSNTELTVEAQGYDGSGTWVTVDSQTISSPSTVSTDVSQLDYTEWRWRVTVSPTGSSPSAEIGYTGVTNVTYVPPTMIANKTVTPVDSPSVTSVDVPSAYASEDTYTVEVTGQAPSSVGYSTTQTGGAVAAEEGATQSDGVSLTLMGLVGGLVVAGVILHGRGRR